MKDQGQRLFFSSLISWFEDWVLLVDCCQEGLACLKWIYGCWQLEGRRRQRSCCVDLWEG